MAIAASVIAARTLNEIAVFFVVIVGAIFLGIAAPVDWNAVISPTLVLFDGTIATCAIHFVRMVTAVVIAITQPCPLHALSVTTPEAIGGAGNGTAVLFVRVIGTVLVTIAPVCSGDASTSTGKLMSITGAIFIFTSYIIGGENHSWRTDARLAGKSRKAHVRATPVLIGARSRRVIRNLRSVDDFPGDCAVARWQSNRMDEGWRHMEVDVVEGVVLSSGPVNQTVACRNRGHVAMDLLHNGGSA